MNWINNSGEQVLDISDDIFGFVYLITYTDCTKYIGKKQILSYRKVLKGKKELSNQDGRASKYKQVIKQSNWKQYEGSTKLSKGKEIDSKIIIHMCKSKIDLTYYEAYYQFKFNVLNNHEYINENILGKFYRGKINDKV